MRRMIKFISIGVVLSILLVACNLPSGTAANPAATLQAVYTAQAGTVQALQTQARAVGASTPPPQGPTLIFPTLPALTASATTAAQFPTVPPIQASATPKVFCDWAAFGADVTIPDKSVMQPGTQFTKTWELKNIGACTWTSSYGLVFVSGNSMNGSAVVNLPYNVAPGQSANISIVLTAPQNEGAYRGYWMLRNAAGVPFGLGSAASNPFYVDIRVIGPMGTVYDFAAHVCAATWHSDAGDLPCPGVINSDTGNANPIQNPQLETGEYFEGLGILTVPQNTRNGYITGKYPPFDVQSGDRFRAFINCTYNSTGCNVLFRLDYQIGNGAVQSIWEYPEIYDNQYSVVDTDLSFLDGESVKFILGVSTNGSAKSDQPLWAEPRIDRPSYLVTPSVTPTGTVTPSRTPTVTPTVTATPH